MKFLQLDHGGQAMAAGLIQLLEKAQQAGIIQIEV